VRISEKEDEVVQVNPDEEGRDYGSWEFTAEDVLEEERKLLPKAPEDIWPHWSKGVPHKLRRTLWCDAFTKNGVRHNSRLSSETLEIFWNESRVLSELKEKHNLLPSNSLISQLSGIYRIFLPDTEINRLCGRDPTGTLYLGLAGTGAKKLSILHNRLKDAAKGDHHAMRQWRWNDAIKQVYAESGLMVEWAFTGMRPNYCGDLIHEARMAESWLLSCYRDSFGEFPPLNERA
jgi:hypothetical protein